MHKRDKSDNKAWGGCWLVVMSMYWLDMKHKGFQKALEILKLYKTKIQIAKKCGSHNHQSLN